MDRIRPARQENRERNNKPVKTISDENLLNDNDPIQPTHYRKGEIDLYESWYRTYPFNEFRAGMQMIAEKATRDKVNGFLCKYHNIRRLAGQPIFSSLESAINSEVQQTKGKNLAKDLIERKNKYINLLNDVHHALSMMPSSEGNLLFKVYMADSIISNSELYNKMNISKNTFYKQKNNALIHFSEIFRGGTLIVLKDLSSNKEFVVKVLGDKYD